MITITLSKKELDTSSTGYQPPLPADQKAHQGYEEEGVVVEGGGAEDFTMGVWNMVMVGILDVAMVEGGVAVEGGVVFGDEDEAMVPSQVGTMTMVNMMRHLSLVAVGVEGEEAVDVEGTGEQLLDQVGVGYRRSVFCSHVPAVLFCRSRGISFSAFCLVSRLGQPVSYLGSYEASLSGSTVLGEFNLLNLFFGLCVDF
ncbi:hypothetical protein CR513_47325 [Mucuna pruriens]|uniref:Uncharacterized protein n=1 Tax=Mucuna pruriens TaxID=157652 RepID=A0A371F4A9_MUCPR|nr:hypothetical protein CR513_47325 [Mucuna pruriens]